MPLTDETLCSLHVCIWARRQRRRQSRGRRVAEVQPRSRARGSLPPLITVRFACLRDGVRRGRACCRVHWSLPLPYVQPSFDPSAQCCPFGDPACFIMQIAMHLPDWPCELCMCVFMSVSRCTRGKWPRFKYTVFQFFGTLFYLFIYFFCQTSSINSLKITMHFIYSDFPALTLQPELVSSYWKYASLWFRLSPNTEIVGNNALMRNYFL